MRRHARLDIDVRTGVRGLSNVLWGGFWGMWVCDGVGGVSRARPAPHRGYRIGVRHDGREVCDGVDGVGGSQAALGPFANGPYGGCLAGVGVWLCREFVGVAAHPWVPDLRRGRRFGGMPDVGKGWEVGGDSRVARPHQGLSRTAPTGGGWPVCGGEVL